MNTDETLVINYLKRRRVDQLKMLYGILGERGEIMRKKDYIEKLTPILLNMIYNRRHEVIISCFSANPEGVSRLKDIIPRICHEETIIPEENLRELFTIFNRPRNQTIRREIVEIRKLYKFLFREIGNITKKRYTYSLDGEDNDDDDDDGR